jgi:hypothetical protein
MPFEETTDLDRFGAFKAVQVVRQPFFDLCPSQAIKHENWLRFANYAEFRAALIIPNIHLSTSFL